MKTIDVLVEELPKRGGWPDGAIGAGFLSGEGTLYFWDKNNDCPPKWTIDTDIEVEDSDEEVTREQYESALANKNDGWIEWGGGECPVEEGALVDVKYRDGVIKKGLRALIANSGRSASRLFWVKDNIPTDIIAYRLHQPQEAEQPKSDEEVDLNECIGHDAAPVWNGEGLPPVGMEIEYSFAKVNYRTDFSRGKVLAYGMQNVFMEHWASKNEFIQPLDKIEFRPIRSQEERKREEAAGKIFDVICKSLTDDSESTSFAIYDAIAAGEIPGVKLEV